MQPKKELFAPRSKFMLTIYVAGFFMLPLVIFGPIFLFFGMALHSPPSWIYFIVMGTWYTGFLPLALLINFETSQGSLDPSIVTISIGFFLNLFWFYLLGCLLNYLLPNESSLSYDAKVEQTEQEILDEVISENKQSQRKSNKP
jgi:hypothetical protein